MQARPETALSRTLAPTVEADEPGSRAGGAATTGSGRVGNVDALRALAALGVLAGHAYILGGRNLPIKAQYWYDVPLISTASGVWLFFAISGYVISRPFIDRLVTGRPLPELAPYALRRGFRIFPLYWIALTAAILIMGVGSTQVWQLPFHYSLLQNLVPGQQAALLTVAWTLTLEVLFYAAVPCLALAVRWRGPVISAERLASLVVISWIASIAFTGFADLGGGSSTALWLRQAFPSMWQMFCPGILIALAPHLRSPAWRRWLVEAPARRAAVGATLVLLIAAAILSAAAPLGYGVVHYVILVDLSRPLFAIGYGIVLAAAIRARPWEERLGGWVLRLGLVSYGIYLLHAVLQEFFLTGVGHDLVPLPNDGLVPYAVHIAFLAGLTIPLAMASWTWFEQPLIQLASRLSDRWRAARRPASSPAGS